MYLEKKVPPIYAFRITAVRFLMYGEQLFLWEAVIPGRFSRLKITLKHVNNYYVYKYFIIITIFLKEILFFYFTVLGLAASYS
jgi:hypothetical protein